MGRSKLTTKQIEKIDTKYCLQGYPKSKYWSVGFDLVIAKQLDLAIETFHRGAATHGCVACIYYYVELQVDRGQVHLALPWAMEGAIRGHVVCMEKLIYNCYNLAKPVHAGALYNFWEKTIIAFGSTSFTKEKRKHYKKELANKCFTCDKVDSESPNMKFEKCGVCKYYSYCGKECQTYHWKTQNHIGECRQLKLLRTFYSLRKGKEIREALIRGEDPTTVELLQTLRNELGLNRPTHEYEDLMVQLGSTTSDTTTNNNNTNTNNNNTSNRPNPYEYLVARKDGTVHIGSTPNTI
mmetsp:Transcript_48318/g.54761  ORF Transcript_48318/g.54761 Transcript_48318/m.54761 type:complete len:295 (+) Transcript_48318:157-1041(+)